MEPEPRHTQICWNHQFIRMKDIGWLLPACYDSPPHRKTQRLRGNSSSKRETSPKLKSQTRLRRSPSACTFWNTKGNQRGEELTPGHRRFVGENILLSCAKKAHLSLASCGNLSASGTAYYRSFFEKHLHNVDRSTPSASVTRSL